MRHLLASTALARVPIPKPTPHPRWDGISPDGGVIELKTVRRQPKGTRP